jgi:hypothetical protein
MVPKYAESGGVIFVKVILLFEGVPPIFQKSDRFSQVRSF